MTAVTMLDMNCAMCLGDGKGGQNKFSPRVGNFMLAHSFYDSAIASGGGQQTNISIVVAAHPHLSLSTYS